MSRTEGGKKAAIANKLRHGDDFYRQIGAMGGKVSRGGFGTETIGKDGLTGRERARIAGYKGGKMSRRNSDSLVQTTV